MLELGATGPRYDEWFMVPMRPLRGGGLSMNLPKFDLGNHFLQPWAALILPAFAAAKERNFFLASS